MGNSSTAIVLVGILNLLFILAQISMQQIALEDNSLDSTVFFHCEGTLLGHYTQECQNLADNRNVVNEFPTSNYQVSPYNGQQYSDPLSSILTWLASVPGLNNVLSVLLAFSTILNAMGLPLIFVAIISGFWYAITIYFFISFAFWRD